MIRTLSAPANKKESDRKALWRRIHTMYDWFNRGASEKCFSLIDPALIEQSNVDQNSYEESLSAFRRVYGSIKPWHTRISLHLDGSSNKHDPRPFAYVYVVWKDEAQNFHMFKERWIKHADKWYTRVVGLVPNLSSK